MRRFAYTNFQISTKFYSKLSYTPCYKLVCGYMGGVTVTEKHRLRE